MNIKIDIDKGSEELLTSLARHLPQLTEEQVAAVVLQVGLALTRHNPEALKAIGALQFDLKKEAKKNIS